MDGVMHPSVEQAIGRDRIRKALERYENKPSVSFENGIVRTVNADGSYEVLLDGDVQPRTCSAYATAGVGDRVLVCIMANGRCVAVSRLEGTVANFKKPVTVNGSLEAKGVILPNNYALRARTPSGETRSLAFINANGNTLFGYAGYSNSEGTTSYYGNNMQLLTKSGDIYANGVVTSHCMMAITPEAQDMTTSAEKLSFTDCTEIDPGGLLELSDGGIKCLKTGTVIVSGLLYASTGLSEKDLVSALLFRGENLWYSTNRVAGTYSTIVFPPRLLGVTAGQTFYLGCRNHTAARGQVSSSYTRLTVQYVD